jgi:hypothetical protein
MKLFRFAAAGAVALLAWGCLLTPGRFDASLDVRRDGRFTYRYVGEMVFVSPGSAMAELAAEDEPFKPEDQICGGGGSDEDDSDAIRDCTPEEIEEKRKEYEEGRAARLEKKKQEAEMAKAMLGGIDPSDPQTMDEFARRLQGHVGWKSVRHKANGVFDVEYELTGRLDHDFVFPMFPEIDYVFPFVKIARLQGNKVRIVAPAFVQANDALKAMGGAMQTQTGGAAAFLKKTEGTFAITTDGDVLTNNTRDGATPAPNGRVLKWTVGPLDSNKPEALLQL